MVMYKSVIVHASCFLPAFKCSNRPLMFFTDIELTDVLLMFNGSSCLSWNTVNKNKSRKHTKHYRNTRVTYLIITFFIVHQTLDYTLKTHSDETCPCDIFLVKENMRKIRLKSCFLVFLYSTRCDQEQMEKCSLNQKSSITCNNAKCNN